MSKEWRSVIDKLLTLLASREGDDLDVVGLSIALRPTQAEIVSAIARLVRDGRIDGETLRPIGPSVTAFPGASATTQAWVSAAAVACATESLTNSGLLNIAAFLEPKNVAAVEDELVAVREDDEARAATEPLAGAADLSEIRAREARHVGSVTPVIVAPAGARKVRPYCQQPDACVANVRGPCRLCHAKPLAGTAPVSGAELAAQIEAFAAEHGLAMRRVGMALFGGEATVARLRRTGTPSASTIQKVRAFVAAAPPTELRKQESGGVREPVVAGPSGAELAAEVDLLIEKHGLSKSAVGRHLLNQGSGVEALRKSAHPRRATVERVRALLADPPIEQLRARAPVGDRRFKPAKPAPAPRRDPTQPPETPSLDQADKQRLNGQRYASEVRRGQEREAAALVDQGVDPSSVKSTFQGNLMRQIIARRADEARQADPVEQAKIALQRKGRTVYAASVVGGPKNRFVVSGLGTEVTPAALIAEAERITGQTFRRSAA
jgi:hypothetical protein